MTKAQEIEVLRKAAATLGPDSYCGPWLLQVIPEIEATIRSDYPPVVTFAEAEARAREIVAAAELRAEFLTGAAQTKAIAIVAGAEDKAAAISRRAERASNVVWDALRSAERALNA